MRVAVAVITDSHQRILITQRSVQTTHAGFWEFPGGKLELDEMPAFALIREIKEEVGLDVMEYRFLGEVTHCYAEKMVSLLVYHVSRFNGEPACLEEQMDLRWVEFTNLSQFKFPAANLQILDMVKRYIFCK